MENDLPAILDLAQTLGTWAIFLFLFIQERTAHENTRIAYRNDLRDIAGMSDRLKHKPPPGEN